MPKGYPNTPRYAPPEEQEVHEAYASPEGMSRSIGANHLAAESAAEFAGELDRNKPIDDGIDRSRKHYAYWRYCVNEECVEPGHIARRGWITIGPSKVNKSGPPQALEFAEAYHAESLEDEYGPMLHNDTREAGPRQVNEIPGNPAAWLEHMFRKPGGFNEVPAEQWKALKLYKSARHARHRRDVTFSDMIACNLCAPGPSQMSREFVSREHLDAHNESAHKQERSSMAVAEAMGRVMNEKGDGGSTAALLSMINDLRSEVAALKSKEA